MLAPISSVPSVVTNRPGSAADDGSTADETFGKSQVSCDIGSDRVSQAARAGRHRPNISSVSSFNSLGRASPINAQATGLRDSTFLDQSHLTPHLGSNVKSLLPHSATLDLYRKNAEKSDDPAVIYDFALFLIQSAISDSFTPSSSSSSDCFVSPSSSSCSIEVDSNPNHVPNVSKSISLGDETDPEIALTEDSDSNQRSAFNRIATLSETNNDSSASLNISDPCGSFSSLSSSGSNGERQKILKEGIVILKKLAIRNYADAQYLLGDIYSSRCTGKKDLKESFYHFVSASKHGHLEASYRVALCYELGWGIGRDFAKAVHNLRHCASRNHPGALVRLGIACFYNRLGLNNHQKEGIRWLTLAAQSTSELFPSGSYELGIIYETGYKDLVIKDEAYAAKLYSRSAEVNYPPAALKLGHAYEYGTLSCPQDSMLSIHYYTCAAVSGEPRAMLALCAWYMVGCEGILNRNPQEGFGWAKMAAVVGLPKAMYAVAHFYENGTGTRKDAVEAEVWYNRAADAGYKDAVSKRQAKLNQSNGANQKMKMLRKFRVMKKN